MCNLERFDEAPDVGGARCRWPRVDNFRHLVLDFLVLDFTEVGAIDQAYAEVILLMRCSGSLPMHIRKWN